MSEFLAEAQVRIVPNTAGFRQTLLAELNAATRGLKVQIPVLAGVAKGTTTAVGAQKQLATSTAAANVETREQIALQRQASIAAREEAAANRAAAKAAADHAAAQSQLARGAGATGLSLLGARGATLAAGSEFLIGAAAVTILAKAIKGAVDDEETLFGVSKVLGDELGNKLAADAQTLANTFGVIDDQALKFEGALSATLRNVGLTDTQIVKFDESLVRVAADLAAVRHVPTEDTLKAIQLAVSGNTRALRQYGIVIQNSEVQQRALAQTGKKTQDSLTRQELTLARLSLLYDRASFAAGGFQANSDSVANKTKILQANIDQLGDSVGRLALGPVSTLAELASHLARNLDKVFAASEKNRQGSEKESVLRRGLNAILAESDREYGLIASAVARANKGLEKLNELMGIAASTGLPAGLQGVQTTAVGAAGGVNTLSASVAGLVGPMTVARQAALDLRAALTGLGGADFKLLRLQASGAPLSAQLSAAQAVLDKAEAAVAAADLTEARKGKSTTQKALLQKELAARQAVTGIQAQIDAATKKEATAVAKAGKTRQQILDEQDQQLLTEQQLAQGQVDIASARAQRTESLVDDLAASRVQLRLINAQIVEAQKIHDSTLRLQTIQQLTLQREQTLNEIRQTRRQQAENRAQRRKDALDAAKESISLDIELAQTTKNVQAEIAARNKLIAFDQKRLAAIKGDTLLKKQLRNEIAANRQAIKDLKNEEDQRRKDLLALQFSFLQTQSGFAANLLSNLIPTGATAGIVGGGIGTPTASSVGGGISTPTAPLSSGVTATQAERTGSPGVTQGQMAVQIQILRGILAAVQRLNGQRTHPGSVTQASDQATRLDTYPH